MAILFSITHYMLAVIPCMRYTYIEMIESFGDRATEDLYNGINSARARHFPKEILSAALRKMDMLNAAHDPDDLSAPPGNRLESLKGDLKGFYSIRVNERWRIIFKWLGGGAHNVSLTDYH